MFYISIFKFWLSKNTIFIETVTFLSESWLLLFSCPAPLQRPQYYILIHGLHKITNKQSVEMCVCETDLAVADQGYNSYFPIGWINPVAQCHWTSFGPISFLIGCFVLFTGTKAGTGICSQRIRGIPKTIFAKAIPRHPGCN